MRVPARLLIPAAIAQLCLSGAATAQQPATAPAPLPGPAIGSIAPDFTLWGSSRYGRLLRPVRLSDFRGKTVVLAFFFQARTKG